MSLIRKIDSIPTVACLILVSAMYVQAFGSDWKEEPRPYFPSAALERNSEGGVVLRVVVTKEGTVDHAIVSQSSGDRALDEAARVGVLKWKMNRNAIKPSDLTSGRAVIIDFREEAALAARFANGTVSSFSDEAGFHPSATERWRSAPFPSYPEEARQRHEEGTVILGVTIAANGDVQTVVILSSSGHPILDQEAVRAVKRWKAHPGVAGRRWKFPIRSKDGGIIKRAFAFEMIKTVSVEAPLALVGGRSACSR